MWATSCYVLGSQKNKMRKRTERQPAFIFLCVLALNTKWPATSVLMSWPPRHDWLSPQTNKPKETFPSLNRHCHTHCHSTRNVKNTVLYLRFSQQTRYQLESLTKLKRMPCKHMTGKVSVRGHVWTREWQRLRSKVMCCGAPWESLELLFLTDDDSSSLQHEPSDKAAWAMESQLVRYRLRC